VSIKEQIKRIPILGNWVRQIYWRTRGNRTNAQPEHFPGSSKYWEHRYASGGNSGVGSYNAFAKFKAEIINAFVAKHDVVTVNEFGCGDGNQLELANYPRYNGFDVSETVIASCKEKFFSDTSKTFKVMRAYDGDIAELALSLDVIFHLVEDDVFADYMRVLFKAANRYVVIYSSDSDDNAGYEGTHVRHRKFTQWIQENVSDWKLLDYIENRYPYKGDYRRGSVADFYIYEKA